MASNSSTNIPEVYDAETSGLPLTFKWLLPSEGGLGQPVYTDHSLNHLRTTGTDHWASMAAPTGTADSQPAPAPPLTLTSRLITGGRSRHTPQRVLCSQTLTALAWIEFQWTRDKTKSVCKLQEVNILKLKMKSLIRALLLKSCAFISPVGVVQQQASSVAQTGRGQSASGLQPPASWRIPTHGHADFTHIPATRVQLPQHHAIAG